MVAEQAKNSYILYYEGGRDVAAKLSEALGAESIEIADKTAEAFSSRWDDAGAFIFVGALAIAVRSVAPLLKDKATDPALVVVSEDGAVAIPVISGHMGGASDLARRCADTLSPFGAAFVPTTASDRSGFVAPDLWASRRGWKVLLRAVLPSVIRKLISNGKISVWVDPVFGSGGVSFPLPFGYDVTESQQDADLFISPRSVQRLAWAKPQIVPRVISAGIGCRRGSTCSALDRVLRKALSSSPNGPFLVEALREFRTAEVKSEEGGVIELAGRHGLPLTIVTDEELIAQEGDFSPSAAARHIGLPGVSEQAAASAGSLLGPRHAEDGVTVALSISCPAKAGELFIVGTGPGDAKFLTSEAASALSAADAIVGYGLYVDLLPPSMKRGKIVERYGMGEEEERVRRALSLARSGYAVALVSGGDPGLFGLAPLALALADNLCVNLIPGITAAQAAAKAIGAPYSNGLALLSLSDYLQPWDSVLRAMEGAERGGIAVALYNPVKRGLGEKLSEVRRIFSKRRLVLAKDAGRANESIREIPVESLNESAVDMRTVMFFLSPSAREFHSGPDGRKIWLDARGYGSELGAPEMTALGQFLVLGGTSEGRQVAEALLKDGYSVTVSVAGETGLATVPDGAMAIAGARGRDEWLSLFGSGAGGPRGVIDATHPFAASATEAIKAACDTAGLPLCRFVRPEYVPSGAAEAKSPEEAADKALELTEEGDAVFLSVGVKMLPQVLPALRGGGRKILARVLPASESLLLAERAGLEPREIIAAWGAGGAAFNEALCADRNIRCIISKESGEAGGVDAKALAAARLDIPLILIRRPKEPDLERIGDVSILLDWCRKKIYP
jgi:cobalt-precorrin 5A hydrolase/precorrin-3B C17-methyltransferase